MEFTDDLTDALGVRVVWSLHQNAHFHGEVVSRIAAAGLDVDVWGAPSITSCKAAFMIAVRRFKSLRTEGGHTRELHCAPLSDARKAGPATAALNLRVIQSADRNALEQVAHLTCSDRGEVTVEYSNSVTMVTDGDMVNALDLMDKVESFVARYGDRVGTDNLRSWLTEVCRTAEGVPFVSSSGDWFVRNAEDETGLNPAQILQKVRDVIEELPGSSNRVSTMAVFPSPRNIADVQYSVRRHAQSELQKLETEMRRLSELKAEDVTSRTPTVIEARIKRIIALRRQVKEMTENLTGSAAFLQEEMDQLVEYGRALHAELTKVNE